MAADRDAASAHARELTDLLDEAQDEIDNLRREVDRLSVPPTSAEGMSDRIVRMMRLASDEASEIRASAANEAAEVRSLAQQEADAIRREAETIRTDVADQREAMKAEHESAMESARREAASIIADSESRAKSMELTAQQNRERVQNDFDLGMSTRREKAIRTITELEEASKAEARERIQSANERSEQTLNTTNAAAAQKLDDINTTIASQIAQARRVTTRMQDLRGSIFDQLEGARAQLAELAAALGTGTDEGAILDDVVPPAKYASVAITPATQVAEPETTAAQRARAVLDAENATEPAADSDAPVVEVPDDATAKAE